MKERVKRLQWLVPICLCMFTGQSAAGETVLGLDKAVDLALHNNPGVEIAVQQCRQGQGQYTQAKSGYLPKVTAGGDYGRQYVKDLQPEDEGTVSHGSIGLTQLIYDFGKTTGIIDAGRFSLQASEANLHQSMQDIVLELKEAFYNVLEKQRLVDVAKEAVDNYAQHLYRARRYFDAGVRTRIDVTNAQVNLSNAKLDLLRAESDLKAARVDFENVLGMRPNSGEYSLQIMVTALEQLAASKPAMDTSLDVLLATAFENRADMRQVHLLTQAAESDIASARGGFFPTIGANAQYDGYDTDLENLRDQWNVSVGLTWELFSGLRTTGEVVEAKARYRELMAGLNDLKLSITREVTESFLRADENRKGVDLADETLGLAKENLVLADGRYQAGLSDIIEFNDAQLNLTRAQSNLVTTYYEYLTALARIERAVGITTGLTAAETESLECRAMAWHGVAVEVE